jgi:DNA polymerase-4
MSSRRAAQLCPDAVFLKPRFVAYKEVSQQIRVIFKKYTPLVEPLSLDEAFLDVTDNMLFNGSATLLAKQIKQDIYQATQLHASAGVSYNKFLAKIASDMDKPNGLYVIKPNEAQAFLDSLPVRKFFGVGKVTEKKLNKMGVHVGNDLKAYSKIELAKRFGSMGDRLYEVVRGIDERPVRPSRKRKSIGKETTFEDDVLEIERVEQTLDALSDRVLELMQQQKILAKTMTLKVKYHDFVLVTRSHTFELPMADKAKFMQTLGLLLQKTDVGTKPIRLVGLNVSQLSSEQPESGIKQQMGLF